MPCHPGAASSSVRGDPVGGVCQSARLNAGLIHPLASLSLARPNIGRRFAVTATEGPVEMGEIAEASLVGDRADGSLREQRIAQHAMRAGQALVEQEPGERRSVV